MYSAKDWFDSFSAHQPSLWFLAKAVRRSLGVGGRHAHHEATAGFAESAEAESKAARPTIVRSRKLTSCGPSTADAKPKSKRAV